MALELRFNVLTNTLKFLNVIGGGGAMPPRMQKFQGQGSNLSHSRDNTRALTHKAMRELLNVHF